MRHATICEASIRDIFQKRRFNAELIDELSERD